MPDPEFLAGETLPAGKLAALVPDPTPFIPTWSNVTFGTLGGTSGFWWRIGRLVEVAAQFTYRAAQGRATTDIAQAARAATYGAVETLIVDMDQVVVGTVADADGAVTLADRADASNYGVVDEIASRALRAGARVISARKADVPGNGALAAILRYAV